MTSGQPNWDMHGQTYLQGISFSLFNSAQIKENILGRTEIQRKGAFVD